MINALTHTYIQKRKRGYQHNYSYDYASSPRCALLIVHNDRMFVQHTMCALNYDTIFLLINRNIRSEMVDDWLLAIDSAAADDIYRNIIY